MIRAGIVHIDRGSEGWLDYSDDPVDPRLHDAVPDDQVLCLIEARDVAFGSGRSAIVSRKLTRATLPAPARTQAKSTRQAFQFPTAGRSTSSICGKAFVIPHPAGLMTRQRLR